MTIHHAARASIALALLAVVTTVAAHDPRLHAPVDASASPDAEDCAQRADRDREARAAAAAEFDAIEDPCAAIDDVREPDAGSDANPREE